MLKLFAKLIVLFSIVATLQVTVVPRCWRMKDVRRLDNCWSQNPDVIYLSDSTNAWIDGHDEDRRPISAMLDELLADASVASVERGAYHAQVYEAFVDLIISRNLQPRAVIVPINLRSFSPEWDPRPEYQFENSKHHIRHADDTVALGLGPVQQMLRLSETTYVSQHEYKQLPVFRGAEIVGRVLEFDNPSYDSQVTDDRTLNKFIFHYMYPLDQQHRKLTSLKRIAEKAKLARLNVVFYITPIDIETGEKHLPNEFRQHVASNVDIVLNTLKEHRPRVLNLALSLPPDGFSWDKYPNEHMKECGRKLVARELAQVMHQALDFRLNPTAQKDEYSPRVETTDPPLTARKPE